MKTSKILIFILSVILLIVVIKYMRGRREGFNIDDDFTYIGDKAMISEGARINKINVKILGQKVNELIPYFEQNIQRLDTIIGNMNLEDRVTANEDRVKANEKSITNMKDLDVEGSLAKQIADMKNSTIDNSLAKQIADMKDSTIDNSLANQIRANEFAIDDITDLGFSDSLAKQIDNMKNPDFEGSLAKQIRANKFAIDDITDLGLSDSLASKIDNIKNSTEILTAIPDDLKNDPKYTPWIGTIAEIAEKLDVTVSKIKDIYEDILNGNPGDKTFNSLIMFDPANKKYKKWYFEISNITDVLKYYVQQSTLNDYAQQSTLNDYAQQSNLTNLETSIDEHRDNTNVHFTQQNLSKKDHNHTLKDLTDWGNHTGIHNGINDNLKKLSNKDHNHTLKDLTDWGNHTGIHAEIVRSLKTHADELGDIKNDIEGKGGIDEKLNFWTKQFNEAVEQDFKVKCLKGGEYGWGPENCPAWLKGMSSK